ncbi:hypothetical protein [Burkholderia arboris]|uniref:hypothetical protein n=1 Tax=Burkholderia arboris TaxID=488730 RepID=UPI00210DCEEE|nr:hypothetical protein [Burkholderia arboris]UTV55794.1 hypothetical protein NLX30_05265 [Burkholderia arboris]
MDELDLFRIADTYTLTDAAALLAGAKPSRVRPPSKYTLPRYYLARLENSDADSDDCDNTPEAFDAALRSLTHAINRERDPLPAMKQFFPIDIGAYQEAFGELPEGLIAKLDPAATTVDAEDLKTWLASRGVKSGFFFPEASDTPDYLDQRHPRYAPKLAAAVKVWLAMEDENLRRTKGAIDAMEGWLETRYKELGLVHERDNAKNNVKAGDMNRTAVEEAAKVANWRQNGGAISTPVE